MTARAIPVRKRSKMARGSCLCGEVAFELVRGAGWEMDCHCSRCRCEHSSVHTTNIFVDARKFRWVRGEEQVSRRGSPQDCHFRSAFCRSCGSALPRVVRSVGIVVVPSNGLEGVPPQFSLGRAGRPEPASMTTADG